jgi:hypothetical protein
MITKRNGNYLLAVVATLVLLAGCKGESPTSPTNNPNPAPPGGSVTPPAGATVTLAVSTATPQVNSTSVITATVAQNGQPVPNGTAVEFTTDLGTFTEANAQTMIRTTTNGVATATLTSSAAGFANVTATVNNVSAKTKITFSSIPTQPPPPDLTPAITGFSPTLGVPQGGTVVTITGKNFSSPKVLFDFGGGKTVPVFIQSSTATTIQVLTPAVDLGAGQQKTANIVVINNAGTPNEVTVTAATPFTFQAEVLTPKITTISPASGVIDGGTKVTIYGEGFQAPLQVFFGSAEAQLASAVTFNQITVIAPAASTTAPVGSGTVLGPVDIKIINILSATTATSPVQFRYIQKMQITSFGPGVGSFLGGTEVRIDGVGFNDPLAVSIGGVAAFASKISGTEIIATTGAILSPTCSDTSGPVVVTNIDNGDSATSTATFTFHVPKPIIVSVNAPANLAPGGSFTITVANPGAAPQVVVGTFPASATNNNGTITVVVPTQLVLTTKSCPAGGTAPQATTFPITVTDPFTTCTVSQQNALTVNPPNAGVLFFNPNPLALSATAAQVGPPVVLPSPGTGTFTIVNNGGGPLTITSVTSSNPGLFTVTSSPPPGTVLQPCDSTVVSISYGPQASGQSSAAQINVMATTGPTNAITLSSNETVTGSTK